MTQSSTISQPQSKTFNYKLSVDFNSVWFIHPLLFSCSTPLPHQQLLLHLSGRPCCPTTTSGGHFRVLRKTKPVLASHLSRSRWSTSISHCETVSGSQEHTQPRCLYQAWMGFIANHYSFIYLTFPLLPGHVRWSFWSLGISFRCLSGMLSSPCVCGGGVYSTSLFLDVCHLKPCCCCFKET